MMQKLNFGIVIPRFVKKVGDGYIFPLGIAYVSASLKTSGFNVFTLNLNHNYGDVSDLTKKFVIANHIDVLCTGGMSMHYNNIFKIIKAAKDANHKIKIIVGGGIITAEPDIAMTALEYVDFGTIGESEITISELAECIEKNGNLSQINGIIYKKDNNFITTHPRQEIMDLDSLPLPDYEAIELDNYLKLPSNFTQDNFFTIIGSRSCPYNCTFCFHTVGRKYRQRPISSIVAEISYLVEKYNIRFFYIADELFGQNKDRVREFCEFTQNIDNFHWRTNFRVPDVDEEMVELLKKGNCSVVSLGLESADNSILKSMRKFITIEQIEKALRLLYDAKIIIEGNFIFGDKEETYDTAMRTLDWWEAHKKYNLNLLWIQTYPGTYLYKYACEKGIIADCVQYLKNDCPAVNVSKMSDDELGKVALHMIRIPFGDTKDALNIKLEAINKETERVDISGNCVMCKTKNVWHNLKLFTFGDIGMTCSACGKRHSIHMPKEIENIFIERINALLSKYDKIGLWGVTYNTFELFNNSKVFDDQRIIVIDASYAKQMIKLNGKKVCSQFAIGEQHIPVIISLYSNYTQSISSLCEDRYPECKKVFDAGSLICMENFQP